MTQCIARYRGFCHSILWISTFLLLAGVVVGCQTLPEGVTPIDIVDVSELKAVANAQECLLVRACKDGKYNESDPIPCFLGLLDVDTAKLVQIHHFDSVYLWPERSPCSQEMQWSPDGTQFMCVQGFLYSNGFVIFGIEGDERFSGQYDAFWSSDGQYLLATTCQGSQGNPGTTITVYAAGTWEPICRVSSSGGSRYGRACGGPGGECQLPLSDSRTLWLQGSTHDYYYHRIFVCDSTGCPATMPTPARRVISSPGFIESESGRYRVYIEDGVLRLEIVETGHAQVYGILGYNITDGAWRP